MPSSRTFPPAAAVSASEPRHGSDAAKLGLKPPRDPRSRPRPLPQSPHGKPRLGIPDEAAIARHVPSSPLARDVMTFRSSSSGDSHGASKSPLHGVVNKRIRKARNAAPAKADFRRHVFFGDLAQIGAPRPSKRNRPRAKYQGSPPLSSTTPSSASSSFKSKPVPQAGPSGGNADSRPVNKRKVLERPKSQPIFKRALANTLTGMIAKCKTKEDEAAILKSPTPVVPAQNQPPKPPVPQPTPTISTAPILPQAKINVSHPAPQPQLKPRVLPPPPIPTRTTFPKHALVATWVSSQVPFATARADRLTRGMPSANASGTGYLIHSPLPFAPPMDHLPEIESDVWSAGDLLDMKVQAQSIAVCVPSDQENWQPSHAVVHGGIVHESSLRVTPKETIAKETVVPLMVQEVEMDEAATILNEDCAEDAVQQDADDASSESSERTVVQRETQDLCSLPGLISSEKHASPPKTLARQDSAIVFAPLEVAGRQVYHDWATAGPMSRECHESPSPLSWAVVPCSDLSMNGLGDEFLECCT
ncbi:hypothetical protein BCR44DRAFT_331573 [Catenaria anguillulae PL171]|uniref:Uncharacterized protein n=1 Tax=Catenaria anguillulae PL171 TaxID=765915 RepID=A0A1Y2HKX2_9FUNG|nr:hypothetical protein BCR44DRAFT_331573 [Catenaria anguillulae PL171]